MWFVSFSFGPDTFLWYQFIIKIQVKADLWLGILQRGYYFFPFRLMPNSRHIFLPLMYGGILFVIYPYTESMALREHLFCEEAQVDLSLRTGLSFALSSPASFYLTKWRDEVSRACQYSSRKRQLWNSFISKGSCFHFFWEYIDSLFSY